MNSTIDIAHVLCKDQAIAIDFNFCSLQLYELPKILKFVCSYCILFLFSEVFNKLLLPKKNN